jgi:hypothetical protein
MFNFFKKKEKPGAATNPHAAKDEARIEEGSKIEAAKFAALKSAIDVQKKVDPLAGPKIGAGELRQRLIDRVKDDKGHIHVETFFTVIGSLAGFSCQMSLREMLAKKPEGMSEKIVWAVANGADGKKYYFGDSLNKPLAESQYSIWSLVADALQQLGATLPDVSGIFKHVAGTVGTDAFGIPRIPGTRQPGDLPINYLKKFWPDIFQLITRFCEEPSEWPVVFGLVIQQTIFETKSVCPPNLAATIVMECAIPMSKVDLPEFYRSDDVLSSTKT